MNFSNKKTDFFLFNEQIIKGRLDKMEELLNQGFDINNKGGGYQSTPLMEAAFHNEKALDFLIKKGANFNEVDNLGCTAFHYAAMAIQTATTAEKFQILYDAGLDIHVQDLSGDTALYWAMSSMCDNGGETCEGVKWLLEHHLDPLVENKQGKSVLSLYETIQIHPDYEYVRTVFSKEVDLFMKEAAARKEKQTLDQKTIPASSSRKIKGARL